MKRSARSFIFAFGKLISILGIFFFGFFQTALPALAQNTQTNPARFVMPSVNSDVPMDQHTLVQSLFLEIGASTICMLVGIDIMRTDHRCLAVDTTTNKLGYAPADQSQSQIGGLIGIETNMIGSLYTPPASAISYFQDLAQNFGITQKSYAQNFDSGSTGDGAVIPYKDNPNGTGYAGLQPLLNFWKASRNLAFSLLVVAFVIVGFGIMLRMNVDPRTVMSIQNQIPKIILTIVLIYFSFAIVGGLIDFMWTLTYAGINFVTQEQIVGKDAKGQFNVDPSNATKNIQSNPVGFYNSLYKDLPDNLGVNTLPGGGLAALIKNGSAALGGLVTDILTQILNIDQPHCGLTNPADCVKYAVGFVFKYISTILAALFLFVVIFVALLRIWGILIKAYAYVLFDLITGPLWILAGIIPGSTALTFSTWIRHLITHLLVFPAVAIMLTLTRVLYGLFDTANQNLFFPPLVGFSTLGKGVGVFIGIGLLLIIPEMLNILRDALKSPASKYGAALGRGIQPGVGFATSPVRNSWKSLMRRDQHGHAQGALAHGIDNLVASRVNPLRNFSRVKQAERAQREDFEKREQLGAEWKRKQEKETEEKASSGTAA